MLDSVVQNTLDFFFEEIFLNSVALNALECHRPFGTRDSIVKSDFNGSYPILHIKKADQKVDSILTLFTTIVDSL